MALITQLRSIAGPQPLEPARQRLRDRSTVDVPCLPAEDKRRKARGRERASYIYMVAPTAAAHRMFRLRASDVSAERGGVGPSCPLHRKPHLQNTCLTSYALAFKAAAMRVLARVQLCIVDSGRSHPMSRSVLNSTTCGRQPLYAVLNIRPK